MKKNETHAKQIKARVILRREDLLKRHVQTVERQKLSDIFDEKALMEIGNIKGRYSSAANDALFYRGLPYGANIKGRALSLPVYRQ